MNLIKYFRFAKLKELLHFKFICYLCSIGTCEIFFSFKNVYFNFLVFPVSLKNTKMKTAHVQEVNSLQNYSCRWVYDIHFFHSDFIFVDMRSLHQCSQAYVYTIWLIRCQAVFSWQAVTRKNFLKHPLPGTHWAHCKFLTWDVFPQHRAWNPQQRLQLRDETSSWARLRAPQYLIGEMEESYAEIWGGRRSFKHLTQFLGCVILPPPPHWREPTTLALSRWALGKEDLCRHLLLSAGSQLALSSWLPLASSGTQLHGYELGDSSGGLGVWSCPQPMLGAWPNACCRGSW